MTTSRRAPPRAFTLIELLVAVAISVVLLSILAFVFRISTGATRDATARVALTERLRSVNIRLRQEIGAMLPQPRKDQSGRNFVDGRTFEVAPDGKWIVFASSTQENGRPVSIDVKYAFLQDPSGDPSRNVLVRYRDRTGPYKLENGELKPNLFYVLGDDTPGTSWGHEDNTDEYNKGDILCTNVSWCKFEAIDTPTQMKNAESAGPPTPASVTDGTNLQPRLLPAAIKMTFEFKSEIGTRNMVQRAVMTFPVYRGL